MSTDPSTIGGTPSWEEIEHLFFAALERAPEQRAAFLEQATSNASLREEVAGMLASEQKPGMAIERLLVEAQPFAAGDGAITAPTLAATSLEGSSIGPYQLLHIIGRGGMGEVYLAERSDQQFQRQVAIKLMGFGEATRSAALLERFNQERRVLAQLQHPGIAQLIDAGSLDDGRPYLVMEYVDGQPITDYCDHAKLDVEARQRLFKAVCDVVQFAHSRLVIHRDLKPSNIMVVDGEDGQPEVKLLDFGIAKLLEPGAMDISQFETGTSARPMTPLFAAPEQFAGEALTTASDVYALGVLFYLLLTGSPPFVRTGSAADYERLVRTGTPRRLTEILSAGKETTDATATAIALRDTTRDRLRKLLSGDVERIAAMALHQDPERRYASAGQLGEDVSRALSGEAVLAQDDTWIYRLRVFVRRNKPAVAAATVTVSLLMILSAFLMVQTLRAQAAQALAEEESQRSKRVTDVLANLFSTADPRQQAVGDQIPVSEFLARVAAAIDRFDDDVTLQTELLSILGQIHLGRDEGQQALAVLSEAAETHRQASANLFFTADLEAEQLGLDHALARATATVDSGQGTKLLRKSLEAHRTAYGAEHPLTARAMTDLARLLDPGAGLRLVDRSLEILRAAPGNHGLDIARALNQRASFNKWAGEHDQSRADSLAATKLLERELGRDHPETLTALHRYSDSLPRDQSMAALRELIPRQERVFGSNSASLSSSLNTLGEHLARMGEVEEATEAFSRAVDIRKHLYGPDSHLVHNPSRNLAMLKGLLGDYQTAADLLTQLEATPAGERSRTYIGIQAAFMRGRVAETRPALAREVDLISRGVATLDRSRASDRDNYPARARGMWVKLLLAAGQDQRALREAETAYEDVAAFLSPEHSIMIEAAYLQARATHAILGTPAEAELRTQLERFEAMPLHERAEALAAWSQLDS